MPLDVVVNDPPTLPGLPTTPPAGADGLPTGPYIRGQGGAIIPLYKDPITRAWTTSPRPTIGPSSDPEVPHALKEIEYRPITTARLGAPIPVLYGRCKVGGSVVRARKWGTDLMAVVVWGEGEVDAVEAVYSDANDVTLATQVQAYRGTQAQTGNSSVASLYGQADDLKGVCYSVLQLRTQDSLNLQAVIRGKKVYDPRSDTTAYSNNAALCLADFIANYTDWDVNWDSVEDAADYCGVTIASGVERWEINMPLVDQKSPAEWVAILAEYANCYVFIEGGVATLIPDEARDVDHVLTASDIRWDTLDLRKAGQQDSPTQVFCGYTIVPETGEWTELEEYTDDPAEDEPLRVTRLKMLGYHHAIQAKRKAIQFQNYANLADLYATFVAFDAGARIAKGDVISITHPIGLSTKKFRVLDCYTVAKGRWRVEGREYSSLLYSTAVVEDPDVPDTDLPDVTAVPDGPTPTEVREVLFTDQTGVTYTRFEIRWAGVEWPFAVGYRVEVSAGSVVVMDTPHSHRGNGVEHLVTTPPTAQGVEYTIRIWVNSPLGQSSETPGSATKTGNGKTIPPSDPTFLNGREANQMVALNWGASVDSDLRGYQIRRLSKTDFDGAGSGPARWGHANVVTVVSRIDSTRVAIEGQPVGSYVYMVKAEDHAGNYSVNFASKLIQVTADQSGVSISVELDWDQTDSVNMREYDSRRQEGVNGGRILTADDGIRWQDLGAETATWESIFDETDQWTKYNTGSTAVAEWWDTGADKTGHWSISAREIIHSFGPAEYYGDLVTAADWAGYPPNSEEWYGTNGNGTGRYIRMWYGAFVPGVELPLGVFGFDFAIKLPFDVTFHGVRVFDSDQESVPDSPQPLAVTFNKSFGRAPVVKAQLLGSTPGFANPDNVTATGFDLHVWDTDGVAMAGTVDWTADGVE